MKERPGCMGAWPKGSYMHLVGTWAPLRHLSSLCNLQAVSSLYNSNTQQVTSNTCDLLAYSGNALDGHHSTELRGSCEATEGMNATE